MGRDQELCLVNTLRGLSDLEALCLLARLHHGHRPKKLKMMEVCLDLLQGDSLVLNSLTNHTCLTFKRSEATLGLVLLRKSLALVAYLGKIHSRQSLVFRHLNHRLSRAPASLPPVMRQLLRSARPLLA